MRGDAGKMTVDQQHYLLQVRDVGITEGQLPDDRILMLLHDNGNDVAGLVQRYYEGETPGLGPPPRRRWLAHARPLVPLRPGPGSALPRAEGSQQPGGAASLGSGRE